MSETTRCRCDKFSMAGGCGRREFNRARTLHLPTACGSLSDAKVRAEFLLWRLGPLAERMAELDQMDAEKRCGIDGCSQPKGHS